MAKNKSIRPSRSIPEPKDVKEGKGKKPITTPVSVSYRYIEVGKKYCLSHCNENDIRAVLDCLRQLTTLDWSDVLKTGGRQKAGMGYTPYEDNDLRIPRPQAISQELKIVGIRATQKMRVFGVYFEHVFYLIWFDPNHEIVPV